MAIVEDCIIVILLCIIECHGSEICDYYVGQTKKFIYCGESCCGTISNRSCCEKTSIGIYIAIVAGALICLALIIVIVIFCVYKGNQKTSVRRHRTHQNGPDTDNFNMMRVMRTPPKPPEYSMDAPPVYSVQQDNHSPFSYYEDQGSTNFQNPPAYTGLNDG